jgi:hypothetical protein
MFQPHAPHLLVPARLRQRLTSGRRALEAATTTAVARVASTSAIAFGSGVHIGFAVPRSPVTSAQALALVALAIAIGALAGFMLGSRWALVVTPALRVAGFELARLPASGPTSTVSASTVSSAQSHSS